MELFIIRIKFAIYYFLHFNTVRQVAAQLRAKSAIYDCLVVDKNRGSYKMHSYRTGPSASVELLVKIDQYMGKSLVFFITASH